MLPFDRETFLSLRARKFGAANPQRVHNVYWEYMVRAGDYPYGVRTQLEAPRDYACGMEPDPDWCFQRFGTTRTPLPDGRVLYIAGEHEDWYDPDFCIYNDLIVIDPARGESFVSPTEGRVELYTFPRELFPPTDFHTATLVGDWIYLIGNLGYSEDRHVGVTPVYRLHARTYQIERVITTGTVPGWIHNHHAVYDAALHAIAIRGGERIDSPDKKSVRQNGFFRLHLSEHRWERVRARETSRAYTLCPEQNPKDRDWSLPPIDVLCANVPGGHVLPSGWSGSPHSPSTPALEIDGVRIDFDAWVDEYRLKFFGELSTRRLKEVFAAIITNADASTHFGWQIRPGHRDGNDE